jgi:hypothetical protein
MPDKTTADEIRDVFNSVRNAKLVGPEELCVLGGRFEAARLWEFMQCWKDALSKHMPQRICEYVSSLKVKRTADALPLEEIDSLERARCFGLNGDLDLRRDGSTIHWRLVAEAGIEWPDPRTVGFASHDYWQTHPERLRVIIAQTLQWRPNEERVGGDWLKYDGLVGDEEDEHHKIFLRQFRYLRGGRLEMVRFIEFQKEAFE